MNEIFISYSRRDKEFVQHFLKGLNDNGYPQDKIWVDWEDIPASSKWEDEIKKGIETANSIIFILSPEWAKSKECDKELKAAAAFNKRLFPIVWQNVDPNTIQKELASLNWIFFRETDNFDEAMQKLIAALNTDLDWVAQHTNLLRRANEWESKGREAGYLLRGGELQAAETWLSHAAEDKQPRPSTLQSEYIYASRKDDIRRQRRNLIWVSTGLVVSVLLAIAAVISQVSALRESQKALASELAAQSIAVVETQPDLALLLSLEANFIGDELDESDPAWLGSLITALNSSPKLETFLLGHNSDVRAVAFSPDGRWLATAGGLPTDDEKTGEAYLWDMKSEPIRYQKLNTQGTDRLLGVAFSADGRTLVAAGNSEELIVWNTDACCDPVGKIPVTDRVRALMFVTISGREYLAAAIRDQVTFWDVTTGRMQSNQTLQLEPTIERNVRVLSLAISPDGNTLAAGSDDGYVTVWDLTRRKKKYQVCSYDDGSESDTSLCDEIDETILKEVRGLAFSPDGAFLVSGSTDKYAWLWDAETGDLLSWTPEAKDGGHINGVTGVAFHPKTGQVATVSWDNTVRLWNLVINDNGERAFQRVDTLAGHSNSIWATAFSPDGNWLVSASSDTSVIVWDVDRVNQIGLPVANLEGEVWGLAVAPDGKQFAAGDEAGNIHIWEFDGESLSELHELKHPGAVLALAYSHDAEWLASAGKDEVIIVWDTQTGKEAWRIQEAHDGEIWSLMFSPDDSLLASASYDETVKLWDTFTYEVDQILQHDGRMFALTFNEDGTELFVAGFERLIYHWDLLEPAEKLNPLDGHIYTVNSLTYNPAFPSLLASTSDDKTLMLWNTDANESSPRALGLIESMEAVAFRPSGDWLASATDNNTVLLWQVDAERCSKQWDRNSCQPNRLGAPLVGHEAPVQNVLFLSDTVMISSDQNGQLILWNLDKSFWYQHACDIVNRPFSEAEISQYLDGRVNPTLLNAFEWFSDLFTSGSEEAAPYCLSQ